MKKWKPTEQEISDTQNWGMWGKEASKFPWYYDEMETCYILEGAAFVTDAKGDKLAFEKGDMVQFEQGLSCTWEITSAIKKKYKFGM